jgi:hypothetical protein
VTERKQCTQSSQWKTQAGAHGRPVLEAVAEQKLTQLVDFATHLKGNTLDLINSQLSGKNINGKRIRVAGP